MRRIGNLLLWTGVAVGVLVAAWTWLGPSAGGMPWILGASLMKLAMVLALSLIAMGAVALRLANRADRQKLLGTDPEVVITADRKAARNEPRLRR